MTRLLALALCALVACGNSSSSGRYSRKQAQQSLKRLESPGLLIGEFKLTKVTDGDTIHVAGLDSSLRLIGMDTEETFKNEADRRAVEDSWEGYLKAKRGDSKRPVKMASPLGEVAKVFAKEWFDGVTTVRVERDHPAELRDRFDRYLAYVFAKKNGVWVCYNVEAVRAGMAPYFPKYGNSRRFHAEFLAAETEAKAAHRGIWQPGVKSYTDYPEREAWWTARGNFVETFRKEGAGNPAYIDVTHWDAKRQIEERVGKEVHLLGTVDDVRIGERGPTRVLMNRFPIMFFDNDVLGSSGVLAWKGEFVVVVGVPTFFVNKNTGQKQLQLVVDRASQIQLSPIPGLERPATPPGP
jgi:endonuclease YncB( thermonuclease family)